MSTTTLAGADKMQQEITRAQQHLTDLRPAYDAATRIVEATARGRTPRRTGRLAASVRARSDTTGGAVEATVPYAAIVHYGLGPRMPVQPWILRAAYQTEPQWVERFEHHTDEALGMIKGLA